MASFWTNALDFPNLSVKGSPIGADSIIIADSTTSPAGEPKQALISTLPFAPLGGSTTVNVTGSTQAMAIDTTYYVNYTGGACTLTLPSGAPQGAIITIVGGEANTAGYIVAQLASQTIRCLDKLTTSGVSGTLTGVTGFETLVLRCDDASAGHAWTATTFGSFSGA